LGSYPFTPEFGKYGKPFELNAVFCFSPPGCTTWDIVADSQKMSGNIIILVFEFRRTMLFVYKNFSADSVCLFKFRIPGIYFMTTTELFIEEANLGYKSMALCLYKR
jgi:hypothetical protein